jgi:hypothetical protein
MSSIVSDLYNGLESIVATQTGFTKLTHLNNLSKNKFTIPSGRYGVLIRDAREVTGSTQRVTHDRRFSVILINSYITDSLNDHGIITKQIELISEFDNIYKEALNTKLGKPNLVMNVSTFDISDPTVVEDEKLIVLEGLITIKSYYSL